MVNLQKEKSVVLIDAQNVYNQWQAHCSLKGLPHKIDYQKLVLLLSEGTNLLRAYFYDGVPDNLPSGKKAFLEDLQRKGIQCKTRITKQRLTSCSNCNARTKYWVQKGVDISLATDILRHSFQKSCDVIVVVSGDEDFKDAIDLAKDLGQKVFVASFRTGLSREIAKTADKIFYLEEYIDQIKQE